MKIDLKRLRFLLYPAGLIIIFLLIRLELQKPLGWDELEHIHSTYLISLGQIPYRDFFEHHHPALWFLFSPIFSITKDTSFLLYFFRGAGISLGMLNLYLVFRISRFFFQSGYWRVLTVLITAFSFIFLNNGFEYRPDNLMYIFILISFELILRQKKFWTEFSGIWLGLAIVVLQKAIVFLPIFLLVIFILKLNELKKPYLQWENFKKFKFIALISWAIVPNIVHFLFYVFNSSFTEYWFFNWTLNSVFDDRFSILRTITEIPWYYHGFFIVLVLVQIKQLLTLSKLRNNIFAINTILISYYALLIFFIRSPYSQYLMPVVLFGSILIVEETKNILMLNKSTFSLTLILMIFSFTLLPFSMFKEKTIQNYTLSRQIEDINEFQSNDNQIRKDTPVQPDNIFFDTKKFYWFSPEGQRTILQLEKENKVPDTILLPSNE